MNLLTRKENKMRRFHDRLVLAVMRAEKDYQEKMKRRDHQDNKKNTQAVYDAYGKLVVLRSRLPEGHPDKERDL